MSHVHAAERGGLVNRALMHACCAQEKDFDRFVVWIMLWRRWQDRRVGLPCEQPRPGAQAVPILSSMP
jgi:hypothetical protein